jgi:hypothetical protein
MNNPDLAFVFFCTKNKGQKYFIKVLVSLQKDNISCIFVSRNTTIRHKLTVCIYDKIHFCYGGSHLITG